MKAMIVGANSGLGLALIEKFQKKFDELILVYNQNQNLIEDKQNALPVTEIFSLKNDIDVIFFIASEINYSLDNEAAQKCLQVNIELLNKVSIHFTKAKIIHTSTVSIYKETNQIIQENSEISPQNFYSLSKLYAEKIIESHQGGGVNLRLSSLFGNYMKESTFLPKIVNTAIQENAITLYGDGSRKQNYISYSELVEYIDLSLNHTVQDEIILATNSKSYSNLEVAQMIQKFNTKCKIDFIGEDNSISFAYDNTKSRKLLDMKKEFDFSNELEKYYRWKEKQYL